MRVIARASHASVFFTHTRALRGARARASPAHRVVSASFQRHRSVFASSSSLAADASDGAEARPEMPDTIAPIADALYPRALDAVPMFFGRLNPLAATLVFYTGAMLRESRDVPIVGAQWLAFVFLPMFALMYVVRKWWYANRTVVKHEGKYAPFTFSRACRSAWLDFHLGYMLLLPAGALGGEGSSFWLLLCPLLYAVRWIGGHKGKVIRMVRRATVVIFGALALATLLTSASTTLMKAIGALRGGGLIGFVLAPAAMLMAYGFYIAPATLLPRAIIRAWTNTLDDDVEVEKLSPEDANKTPEELSKDKKKKRTSFIIGVVAFGATLATGSDIPLFILFALQLIRVDPGELMNALIDKGSPERAEFEQKVADKFSGVFKKSESDDKEKKEDARSEDADKT